MWSKIRQSKGKLGEIYSTGYTDLITTPENCKLFPYVYTKRFLINLVFVFIDMHNKTKIINCKFPKKSFHSVYLKTACHFISFVFTFIVVPYKNEKYEKNVSVVTLFFPCLVRPVPKHWELNC